MSYYETKKEELEGLLHLLKQSQSEFSDYTDLKDKEIEEKEKEIKIMKEGVKQLAKERQIGFPWLAKAYDELFYLYDKKIEDYFINKKHPAVKTSERIKRSSCFAGMGNWQ